jgi:hypothetical protein
LIFKARAPFLLSILTIAENGESGGLFAIMDKNGDNHLSEEDYIVWVKEIIVQGHLESFLLAISSTNKINKHSIDFMRHVALNFTEMILSNYSQVFDSYMQYSGRYNNDYQPILITVSI